MRQTCRYMGSLPAFSDIVIWRRVVDPSSEDRSPENEVSGLVSRFRLVRGYPLPDDNDNIAARHELLRLLTRQSLDAAIADPGTFDMAMFNRLAYAHGACYGYPGDQRWMSLYLKDSGPQEISRLAGTIRHLLYGPGSDEARLNDVLNPKSRWKVPGFAEALAVKCLAIVYPDRWVPFFVYPSENGKKAIMRLLPIPPLDERGKSKAALAKESNDILRELLEPYFPNDPWGPVVFLWWLLNSSRDIDLEHATRTIRDRVRSPPNDLEQLRDQDAETLSQDANNVPALIRTGRRYQEHGETARAIETFERVLAIAPGNTIAAGRLRQLRR
jgi:hypothetical protein